MFAAAANTTNIHTFELVDLLWSIYTSNFRAQFRNKLVILEYKDMFCKPADSMRK